MSGTTPACPCGTVSFPEGICNPAGLPAIDFRIGDFVAFRHRLLQSLPNETELSAWRPGAQGDLAVQMIEWWAYLADILTFYNERIANEAYLGTALLPESVNHLVQVLGYRPKPALGARGTLAALLSPGARVPLTVPGGLQVQSKPGPGQAPQVFELDKQTTIGAPDVVRADVVPSNTPLLDSTSTTLWLAGKIAGIKPADRLLLINAQVLTAQTIADYAWIKVSGTTAGSDPLGNPVTQLAFSAVSGSIASGAKAAEYVLLRSQQSSPLWGYPNSPPPISTTGLELAGIARGVTAGSLLLVDVPDGAAAAAAAAGAAAATALQSASAVVLASPSTTLPLAALETAAFAAATLEVAAIAAAAIAVLQTGQQARGIALAVQAGTLGTALAAALTASAAALATAAAANPAAAAAANGLVPTPVIVRSYAEVVWYANGQGPTPPIDRTIPAIAIPHAEIGLASPGLSSTWWQFIAPQVTVRWGWLPVGPLVPVLGATDMTYPNGGTTLVVDPASSSAFPPTPVPVLLEDIAGNGAAGTVTTGGSPFISATLSGLTPQPAPSLASPIDLFFNLLGVSRGKTVPSEVLGSGNPSVAGQDFTLAQSPVTYQFDPASVSGSNFSSTVKVWVNGVQWQEVQSFYGQLPNAQVFVLREDDQGRTHATFGDGVNGAVLPTGTNNVVATYRYGAGYDAPASETLTVVLTPTPGLKGVQNPLPPTGGGDADQPSQLRSLAPRSVLTFNRAVSADDYAAIALTASGVTQAVASFAFDPLAQRPVVTLWIAGDDNARVAPAAALAGTEMPNQGLRVHKATPVPATLSLSYGRDPRYDDKAVQTGLTTALLDPDTGLLGAGKVGIGQAIYQSQIAAACLAVPGVTAIQNVALTPFESVSSSQRRFQFIRRFVPPPSPSVCSGQRFTPGPGNYFSLPNDGRHLSLTGTTS
jgi:hypothetical protein